MLGLAETWLANGWGRVREVEGARRRLKEIAATEAEAEGTDTASKSAGDRTYIQLVVGLAAAAPADAKIGNSQVGTLGVDWSYPIE